MFADSLCDAPWANRPHRGWTTLASFGLQVIALASLLLLPLIYTSGLPPFAAKGSLVAPAPPPAAPPPAQRAQAARPMSNIANSSGLITPPSIPSRVEQVVETTAPPAPDLNSFGVPGGTGDRAANNPIWNSVGSGLSVAAPPPTPVSRPPRISRMMEGNLIYRVQPEYPMLAKMARVQGSVVLRATISKAGLIENLQVVSGPPLLVQAAKAAVSQWRYRPYYLNNEPVEVETQVTVNFVLSGG